MREIVKISASLCLLTAASVFPFCLWADGSADASADRDPFSDNLPTVEAAALHVQTLDEAPASVTVITKEQIRTYGYRTLGEALNSVRGFYLTSDHIYHYAGVRGFSLPGDFNTRFLVMINGHAMTEPVFSSNNFFGQDFGLDMDLVERIEVIRGPSSALYGSNGIFATINVVTISPVDFPAAYLSNENGSWGAHKGMAAGSFALGRGANLLVSASGFKSSGQNFEFPELGGQYGGDRAVNMDGEGAYHTFANLTWGAWSFTAYFNDRDKRVPLAWDPGANTFFSEGNHAEDSRNFATAAYRRMLGRGDLRWQISYDKYHYADRFDYLQPDDSLLVRHSYADSDTLSTQATYQFAVRWLGDLTAGLALEGDIRNLQEDRAPSQASPILLRVDRPQRDGALFVEQEKKLSRRWKLDAGLRWDWARYYGQAISPRIALAYQPSAKSVYKFVYGRPYRNPSNYEQFYYDNIGFLKPPALQHETAQTFELSAEHHFTPSISGIVNVFDYRLYNLIEAVFDQDGVSQVQNVAGTRSRGVEFEVDAQPRRWLELGASVTIEGVQQHDSPPPFVNSPDRMAKFRFAVPAGRRLKFAASVMAMSSRGTFDYETLRPVLMADATVTWTRVVAGFDLQAGVRNALNWSYVDPVGLSIDTLEGDPRSFYAKLTWHSGR